MKSIPLIATGIALAVTCWGVYGPTIHEGQRLMGSSRLKPLICVGVAYLVVAIVVPVLVLASQGALRGEWTVRGVSWSLVGGVVGALGAVGIILAMAHGGNAIYVMPLVFGGAPVVNTLYTMYWSKAYKEGVNPLFYVGLILAIAGAATVLVYAPKAHRGEPTKPAATAEVVHEGAEKQ